MISIAHFGASVNMALHASLHFLVHEKEGQKTAIICILGLRLQRVTVTVYLEVTCHLAENRNFKVEGGSIPSSQSMGYFEVPFGIPTVIAVWICKTQTLADL